MIYFLLRLISNRYPLNKVGVGLFKCNFLKNEWIAVKLLNADSANQNTEFCLYCAQKRSQSMTAQSGNSTQIVMHEQTSLRFKFYLTFRNFNFAECLSTFKNSLYLTGIGTIRCSCEMRKLARCMHVRSPARINRRACRRWSTRFLGSRLRNL